MPASIHIRKKRGLFDIDWAELWRFRDLLYLLVYRDFASRYKQTVLGPLWFIIQPIVTTLIFTVIFGKVAKLSTDGVPPLLFYLCGMLGWNYFSSTVGATSTTFQSNAHLFGKVYFPRLIVPVAAGVSQLIGWAIQFLTFLAVLFYYLWATSSGEQLRPNWSICWFPLLLLQSGMIALGVGFWLSCLSAKYRDFQNLNAFLLQVWMYLTPIVYPLSSFPEKYKWLAALNPMTMVVENTKYAFLGAGTVRPGFTIVSALLACLIFGTGVMLFQKVERSFIDSV